MLSIINIGVVTMTEQEQSKKVYVGDKPLKNYVKAIRYRVDEHGETTVVARGNNIRTAVDASEIVKREEDPEGFETSQIDIEDVSTFTDTDENEDGSEYSVSRIELSLSGEVEFAEEEKEE